MSHEFNRERFWRTADGRGIAIKDMKDGHLVNVVNWIIDNPESYTTDILDLMVAEAKYRQVLLFAEGKAYPQKVGQKWKLIDPETGVGRIEKPPADYIEAVKHNPAYTEMFKRTQAKRKASNGSV
jgi:hypothetical protein